MELKGQEKGQGIGSVTQTTFQGKSPNCTKDQTWRSARNQRRRVWVLAYL